MTYKKRRKPKIAVKSTTLQHDVLSIAREASAAPAATFKRGNRVRRERCWSTAGVTRPGTVSLHPVAIEAVAEATKLLKPSV